MTVFILKLIAMIAMLIDHTAAVFAPQFSGISPWFYTGCRMIGRLAFPIFAFCIAEGSSHTKNVRKYLTRMFIFALAAQIPFSLMTGVVRSSFSFTLLGSTVGVNRELSVMVTLFLGLAICVSIREKKYLGAAFALIAAYAVELTVGMDYGLMGVLFIAALWFAREKKWMLLIVMLLFPVFMYIDPIKNMLSQFINQRSLTFSAGVLYAISTAFTGFLVLFYNGKPGRKLGILGYVFYPAHMLLLWAIHFVLTPGAGA